MVDNHLDMTGVEDPVAVFKRRLKKAGALTHRTKPVSRRPPAVKGPGASAPVVPPVTQNMAYWLNEFQQVSGVVPKGPEVTVTDASQAWRIPERQAARHLVRGVSSGKLERLNGVRGDLPVALYRPKLQGAQ